MSKYITKEEYIKAIEEQKVQWIEADRKTAEVIANRIKAIHPRSFAMNHAIPNRDNVEDQIRRIKNRLAEILPFLEFDFTPIGRSVDCTSYIISWKLKEEEN